ncbi:nitrous oxide reductase family maturation protein NosD [Subsaximicrobium wynnwilliamsii]|uniref:Nitrous oxide reductase family maturation protein NosD n=1 Tax=Subsaximicrobium wynnwilliamsii TaxID=291179 RepID=A0A5C6ZIL6_9FLAO|nr:nitrous oxide reductase family maturation protein NosD [Subsaximicrobium wynnwilliamsii]TXD83049.1 nitrous oxide reductase family maturation protein NosD [Subsaximicrobium wynnwilliamsii]TXD88793.1 nitrous oxide reductase family maturation protein NosD [Subsaximicrobium wynnwilliamsii]TXE02866.1 nitrous oxide reductase family maturation protein NosD [Subsaximicrobium wynnwilliamsii]
MKKLVVFFTIIFMTGASLAQTLEVCTTCPISSLKAAIAKAKAFDTVVVKKGRYNEYDVVIDKPLTIIGKNHPVIDGKNKGEIITIVSDSVTVDGLHLINVGTSYTEDYAAIRVKSSAHFVIRNLILEKLFFGIYIEKSNHGKIRNNKIIGDAVEEYNSGNGIQLWYSKHVDIEDNIVQHVRDGIYLEFSDFCTIKNNLSSLNVRYGLHFMFSNDDVYQDNEFSNNGAGVAVMFSKRIKMYNNLFKDNWGSASYGMLLKEINDSEIIGNTFEDNTVGINIEGSNRIIYKHNNFSNNGWAIKVRGACYANTYTENNFLYNSFDMAYNSNVNDNTFDRNYWSNYTGYDLNKDGVGDVPYRPVKLFTYIVNRTPETIILLRSMFIDIIDFSEKVSPVFTPDDLLDNNPLMKKVTW